MVSLTFDVHACEQRAKTKISERETSNKQKLWLIISLSRRPTAIQGNPWRKTARRKISWKRKRNPKRNLSWSRIVRKIINFQLLEVASSINYDEEELINQVSYIDLSVLKCNRRKESWQRAKLKLDSIVGTVRMPTWKRLTPCDVNEYYCRGNNLILSGGGGQGRRGKV